VMFITVGSKRAQITLVVAEIAKKEGATCSPSVYVIHCIAPCL
jgi:hypothetical protein